MQLIDKDKLYNKLIEQEEMIEERCSDLLKVENKDMRKYIQYRSTLSTIKSFEYIMDNEPVVKAIPIELIDDIVSMGISEYNKTKKQLKNRQRSIN